MPRFRSTLIFATSVFALVPVIVSAQVVISEFMYDAQGSDSDQEYVELFNAGSTAVDLTKWKFNDGSNHVLNVPPKNGGTGSITIQSGSYALLVDNATNFINTHSGISVSVIDAVMSLPNASGTISLINESGATEDSVSYSKDIGAAGDGNTLHRTSVSGTSFSAATPTPGTGSLSQSSSGNSNTTTQNNQENSSATTTTTTTTTTSSSLGPVSSASNFPVEPQIFAYAGKDRDVIAGADTIFEARATDKKGEPLKPGRFLWTFGDGASAEGQTVMHHFAQPGRYAVVLDIADGLFVATHQIIVTALPVSIALSLQDGNILLTNKSGKNLDLSYWVLRAGGKLFTIPKNTVLLGGASVPFVSEVTHLSVENGAMLLYPNGVVVTDSLGSSQLIADVPAQTTPSTLPKTEDASRVASVETIRDTSVSGTPAQSDMVVGASASASNTSEAALAGTTVPDGPYPWWLEALGVALAGSGAIVAVRHARKREWDIVEESID